MLEKKTWEEFRNSGLLWLMNTLLHAFGWVIVTDLNPKSKKVERVYPARCKFRGFREEINTEGYRKVAQYMADEADLILQEAE